ncbi:unnamed protein product [Effrenium voratum]|uniref:Uncharacterized protein n=1 Tax=Effrenium voratum TaxID=2562239 RepID=A0AA36HXN5_9DINO|nr:unnamed protein product [Effrenium voratum]
MAPCCFESVLEHLYPKAEDSEPTMYQCLVHRLGDTRFAALAGSHENLSDKMVTPNPYDMDFEDIRFPADGVQTAGALRQSPQCLPSESRHGPVRTSLELRPMAESGLIHRLS